MNIGLKFLHFGIILNFVIQVCYSAYMVFFVMKPEGVSGPLYEAAKSIPFEFMMTRRMYATEFWIAFSGLSIYLAITEFYPRIKKEKGL